MASIPINEAQRQQLEYSGQHVKTDNFRTAVEYASATGFHLSLNLELLRGCQFNCRGCHVDKYAAEDLDSDKASKLQKWVNMMVNDGLHHPTVVFIGPTDILTADNSLEVLSDPNIVATISKFRRLSIQTTCLNLDAAPALAKVLKEHYSHMELEVNILFEPEHLETTKYLETIRDSRNRFFEILDWHIAVKSFCIMNVYEYQNAKNRRIVGILKDYKQIHHRIKDLFDTTIDFNFSMSRKNGQLELPEIQAAVRQISDMFDEAIDNHTLQFMRFSFGKITDSLIEKHYNYFNGEIYASPLLYDRYAAFIPEFHIPMKDHTFAEMSNFENDYTASQYASAVTKTECGSCRYLGSCVDRGIIKLMDAYQMKDCIIARKALDAINIIPG